MPDCVTGTLRTIAITSIFGGAFEGFREAFNASSNVKQAVGRVGMKSFTFGLVGGVYTASSCSMQTFRGVDDPINSMFGGVLGGTAFGLLVADAKRGVAVSASLAAGMALYNLYGDNLLNPEASRVKQKSGYPEKESA